MTKTEEALRPDKEKIFSLANTLNDIGFPYLSSKEAKEILIWFSGELDALSKLLRQKGEKL